MNIGIDLRCLQEPERTGVGEYAFELVTNILKEDRVNRYFLFFNSAGNIEIPKFYFPNAEIARFKIPNKLLNLCFLLLRFPKLDRLIAKKFALNRLDLFFSPNLNFVALSKNAAHHITVHDLSFEFFPEHFTLKQRIWHFLANLKRQCKNARHIITPSENTRRDVIKYFGIQPDRVTTIYPGLSSALKTDVQDKINLISGKYLLFIGTFEPRKNISALVSAFENVAREFNDVKLVIAGAGGWKNRSIKKIIKNSKFSDRIILPGYIKDSDKKELYKNSLAFIYPSLYEGFGFPVLEAMASGTPVITSSRSSLPEITGDFALLVDPRRPGEIAEAIKNILRSEGLRKDLVEKGLISAKKFDWNKTAKEWLVLTKP